MGVAGVGGGLWPATLCKGLGLDAAGRELTQHGFLPGPGEGIGVSTGH